MQPPGTPDVLLGAPEPGEWVPLDEAVLRFAAPELRARAEAAKVERARCASVRPPGRRGVIRSSYMDGGYRDSSIPFSVAARPVKSVDPVEELLKELWGELRGKLRGGELEAEGTLDPVSVEPEIFRPGAWAYLRFGARNCVRHRDGRVWFEVRVRRPALEKASAVDAPVAAQRAVGRVPGELERKVIEWISAEFTAGRNLLVKEAWRLAARSKFVGLSKTGFEDRVWPAVAERHPELGEPGRRRGKIKGGGN